MRQATRQATRQAIMTWHAGKRFGVEEAIGHTIQYTINYHEKYGYNDQSMYYNDKYIGAVCFIDRHGIIPIECTSRLYIHHIYYPGISVMIEGDADIRLLKKKIVTTCAGLIYDGMIEENALLKKEPQASFVPILYYDIVFYVPESVVCAY